MKIKKASHLKELAFILTDPREIDINGLQNLRFVLRNLLIKVR